MCGFPDPFKQKISDYHKQSEMEKKQEEIAMKCEECQQELWKAGDIVPAGAYARVDDQSYHVVLLEQAGRLPATFDGHLALYCASMCRCAMRARFSQEKQDA